MIDFTDIIGHEDIIRHFKSKALSWVRYPRATSSMARQEVEKKTLTRALVKTLQCEEGGTEPCNHCKSCLQCETGNQPDIVWVTHDKPNVISVEEIRDQVNSDIDIKPYSKADIRYML